MQIETASRIAGPLMDAVTRLANESWEALSGRRRPGREFELEGEWGGLPPREYGVLYALAGAKDGLRITALIDDALLTQAGVSRLVARLEKRGLVARRDDPADARACLIVLDAEGRQMQRRVGAHARPPCHRGDDPSPQSGPAGDPPTDLSRPPSISAGIRTPQDTFRQKKERP